MQGAMNLFLGSYRPRDGTGGDHALWPELWDLETDHYLHSGAPLLTAILWSLAE
jgi:hypothetical protein